MQFSAIATLFTLAAVATAAPTEVAARNDGSCTNNQQAQVCCTDLLSCLVVVLGSPCTGQSYCCSTTAGPGSPINVNILNCVSL
ncbi:hypothetical protein GGR54DRAFT_634907 [Hypoxylon sp. NC1633]|nr:hypothetical protein GGR54DRAFT_634907 [Hypoxylon sp. NC1633]